MRLQQLQYFSVIAKHKNITLAAEELYLSQPALSKQMALLEEELGVTLMKRQARGIVLTEAGIQFAADCEKVFAAIHDAVDHARSIGGVTAVQEFRIGCFEGAYSDDFLPQLIAYLQLTRPDLNITVLRNSMEMNRKQLDEGKIDLLIGLDVPGTEMPAEEVNKKVLTHRKNALIYSASSPLAKKAKPSRKDFLNTTYYYGEGPIGQAFLESLRKFLKPATGETIHAKQTENIGSIISSVKLGLGYAFLSPDIVKNNPNLISFPLPEEWDIDVVAVWRKENTLVGNIMQAYKAKV